MIQPRQPGAATQLAQEHGMRGLVRRRAGGFGADFTAPSGSGFIALLESFRSTGGTAPAEIVGRLLEEHRVGDAISLAKLLDAGQAFGFEWRASLWIPMFQFDANDLTLKTGVQRVRAELPSLWSGWDVASWFAASNARLDGRTPAEWLEVDAEAVGRVAQSLESVDAFSLPQRRRSHQVFAHA